MNILFVAFEFPPLLSGGVQRSLKFVKYLPDYNITPVVITVKEEDYPAVLNSYSLDPKLLRELPAGTKIERVHCKPGPVSKNSLSKWSSMFFSISENFKDTWKEELKKVLPAFFEKYKPVAVYVSLPPFAMGELWLELLRSNPVPLIVDFRDAWSQWCMSPNGTYLHYQFKLRAERRLLERANKVIFSSRESMLDMQRVHPAVDQSKFSVIHNGYDGPLPAEERLLIPRGKKIVIGYVGSFYYTPSSRREIFLPWWRKAPHRMFNYVPRKEDWLYRSPYFFFKSLQALIQNDAAWAKKIEVRFAGNTPSWLQDQIRAFGLEKLCHHHGFLDHEAVIKFQQECDILLITSAKVLGGRDYSIAGKTYEYFTIGKPILAFVSEGAQKDILEKSGMAVICDPDQISDATNKMAKLFNGEITLEADRLELAKYHRKVLTGQLAKLIKQTAEEAQPLCAV